MVLADRFLGIRIVIMILFGGGFLIVGGCGPSSSSEPADLTATSTVAASPQARYTVENPARVLHLDSYHPEYLWSQSLDVGIAAGMADFGYDMNTPRVELQRFYMDTKRENSLEYLAAIAEQALAEILREPPDVLIATDDNAIRRVAVPLLDSGIPIVFSGLNGDPEDLGIVDSASITGVLERVHIEETLAWIQRVLPDAQRVLGVFDASVTTRSYLPSIEEAIAASPYAQQTTLHFTNSYEEWQSVVRMASRDYDVILMATYHTLQNAYREAVHEDEVIAWTIRESEIPVVPLWDFGVQQGALGGSVISGETQGYEAGRLAAQILNGVSPAELPIITPSRGLLALNVEALNRWDVTIPLNLVEISTIYGQ